MEAGASGRGGRLTPQLQSQQCPHLVWKLQCIVCHEVDHCLPQCCWPPAFLICMSTHPIYRADFLCFAARSPLGVCYCLMIRHRGCNVHSAPGLIAFSVSFQSVSLLNHCQGCVPCCQALPRLYVERCAQSVSPLWEKGWQASAQWLPPEHVACKETPREMGFFSPEGSNKQCPRCIFHCVRGRQ